MFKNKIFGTPICLFLSLLLLVDFTIFNPSPVKALDKKSVAIGAGIGLAAGAGAVIAAPAIGTAMAAAGTGIAGIGAAIIGGLSAAAGAIVGAASAVIGAVAAAGAAIGGWIMGLIASPLFIPALIVIGVCVAGYLIYRHYKNKKGDTTLKVIPENERTIVVPGAYDMNPVMPPMNQAGGVTLGDDDGLAIPGNEVTISNVPPADITVNGSNESFVAQGTPDKVSKDIKELTKRYQEAYKRYTKLVTTGGQGDVQSALKEYRAAFDQLQAAKKASGVK